MSNGGCSYEHYLPTKDIPVENREHIGGRHVYIPCPVTPEKAKPKHGRMTWRALY